MVKRWGLQGILKTSHPIALFECDIGGSKKKPLFLFFKFIFFLKILFFYYFYIFIIFYF